jgi:hypothetical protein
MASRASAKVGSGEARRPRVDLTQRSPRGSYARRAVPLRPRPDACRRYARRAGFGSWANL